MVTWKEEEEVVGELKDIEDVVAGGRVMKSVETDRDDDVCQNAPVRVGSEAPRAPQGKTVASQVVGSGGHRRVVAGLAGMLAGVVFDR